MNIEQVPSETIKTEKEIIMKQISSLSNKPPEVIQKILNGKLAKFYEEVCLTEQAHMLEEGNPKVGKYLKKHGLDILNYEYMST